MRLTTAGVVVASQNGGPIAGHRNRVINGNFIINQRNVASASTAYGAGVYCLDRWKAGAAGATLSWAVSGADVIVTITAGSIMQVVEDVNIEGGVYALSHAGSAQARIGINGAAPAAAYAVASQAAPVASATATAKQTVTVEFSTGTVSKVQLEPVDSANVKATPFERRLYGAELMLCQRYYEAGFFRHGGYMAASASNMSSRAAFKATKRASPTINTSSVSTSSINTAGAPTDVGVDGFTGVAVTNGAGSGDAYVSFNWTVTCEL